MITQPTLLLDTFKCKRNIRMMADKANKHHVSFRPHFKTHQSLEIGRWFKEVGVDKITVSSLSMAKYFSSEWNDITVAFPVNIAEIATINTLAKKITLNLCIENIESLDFLVKQLTSEVNILLKIDVGYHRTGIDPNNSLLINNLLKTINSSSLMHFKGLLGHAGHSYKCKTKSEVKDVHAKSMAIMKELKNRYLKSYPKMLVSLGDTPGCSIAEDFSSVDEIRPGNFVFYDLTQQSIGSNSTDQIAVALACPIVAIHKDRSEIVVYGGGIHLSKEQLSDQSKGVIFGRIAEKKDSGWGNIITESCVNSLSQEHGIIRMPESIVDNYKIGEYLLVLPVHSCMTANLMKQYLTTDGKQLSMMKNV